jgi:hypothetical protein
LPVLARIQRRGGIFGGLAGSQPTAFYWGWGLHVQSLGIVPPAILRDPVDVCGNKFILRRSVELRDREKVGMGAEVRRALLSFRVVWAFFGAVASAHHEFGHAVDALRTF